jgi:thymidylate synthase
MINNNIENDYLNLIRDIRQQGNDKSDRTGTGTFSVFGRQIRHDMSLGYPLLTTKKMAMKTMVTELVWFLKGDTKIKFLQDNKCRIWNGDLYKNYYNTVKDITIESLEVPFEDTHLYGTLTGTNGKGEFRPYSYEGFIDKIQTNDRFNDKWGDLGPIYGHQWRDFNGVDQIKGVIDQLKSNPDSRRLIVSAWNVSDLKDMVLPPCHNFFQFYTRELTYLERYDLWFKNNYETGMEHNPDNKPDFDDAYYTKTPERAISLMWNQRSVDVPLGLPFNISSYALLLEVVGKMVNMVPDELVGTLGDTHIYKNQIELTKTQLERPILDCPEIKLTNSIDWTNYTIDEVVEKMLEDLHGWYELVDYKCHDKINYPLSN